MKFYQSPYALFSHRYFLLLLIFTSAIFFKGVTPSFSSDDYVHLENNIHFKNLTEVSEVFVKPFGREYRPMVRFSLWLDHQLGDTALPYKTSNLLMHLLCITLLYSLMLRLGVSRTIALLASAIFALHPIHTTSVHFILGRTDLVASLFYLATLCVVAGWQQPATFRQQVFAALPFTAALLSKELSITLPVMMLAILLVQRKIFTLGTAVRTALSLWPYALIASIYLLVRVYQWNSMSSAVSVYTNFSLLNIAKNYAEWGFGLLYPFDLYLAREWQMLHPRYFIVAAVITGLFVIGISIYIWRPAIRSILRSPLFWLGISWIFITLIPMMGGSAHRWYLYLPSAGLSLIVASLWPLTSGRRRQALTFLLGLTLLVYSGETLRQAHIWQVQSDITEQMLSDTETRDLRHQEEIVIANMPFGYKSAFLFTHSAFEEALRVRYDRSPKIQVLSYINMDDINPLTMSAEHNRLSFSMEPNAHRYFRLRNLQIFFSRSDTFFQDKIELSIDRLDSAGRITTYSLKLPEDWKKPVYYFDGKRFQRFNIQ